MLPLSITQNKKQPWQRDKGTFQNANVEKNKIKKTRYTTSVLAKARSVRHTAALCLRD